MPRFLSLHKHYCALSRAWRACLYPRSGKVGSSQSLQSSLWLLLVSQWSLALKEEASYISPRSLQTSSTFGLIVATITLTSILRYRYHEYFLEKNDLKNLFEEKKIHRFAFGRKPEQPNLNNFLLRRPVNFYVLVVPFKTIPVSRL